MADLKNKFARTIYSKLGILEIDQPNLSVIQALIDVSYLASLHTEEGRFIRGSLTYAIPQKPEHNPPIIRRADYPSFTAFFNNVMLTAKLLVKLYRAVDKWCGSIAVYGTRASDLYVWGVIDQVVHHNISLNNEPGGGAPLPGALTISIDAVGELSAYHANLFLGSLRKDRIVMRENDALLSTMVALRILPHYHRWARHIGCVLMQPTGSAKLEGLLLATWARTIARLCIGLRRLGTGGAFLLTPRPKHELLEISFALPYDRLQQATILGAVDEQFGRITREFIRISTVDNSVDIFTVTAAQLAEADAEDRDNELTGAVKLITSIASVDGLVLLTPTLSLVGFGVKITSSADIGTVYDGSDFSRRARSAQRVDISRLGTRHASMLRYCRADPKAIGVIVSQDGHVRIVVTSERALTIWDDVQLLSHVQDVRKYANEEKRASEIRELNRDATQLGYSPMPKTLDELARWRSKGRLRREQLDDLSCSALPQNAAQTSVSRRRARRAKPKQQSGRGKR